MNTAALRAPLLRRPRQLQSLRLRGAVLLLLLLLSLPLLALVGGVLFGAAGEGEGLRLPALLYMLGQTLFFVGGVLALALLLAVPSAWAVVMLNFPGRKLAVWLLLLPFALPPYLVAFTYDDFFRGGGVYLPGGLVAVGATALALYPYIFFLARFALLQQHCHIQSAARLLGCSPWAAFWRVSLPMARPAIVIGAALAAMEALNDIAVAEYFAVQTLGAGIYDLWLNRGDMLAGARLAVLLAAIVFALVWLEERARRRQAQYTAVCDKCYECERATRLSGGKALLLWGALAVPMVCGFWLPLGHLFALSTQAMAQDWQTPLLDGLAGSMLLSGGLAVLLLAAGALVALEKRINKRGAVMHFCVRLARIVYALPGTVVAQGVFLLALGVAAVSGQSLLAVSGLAVLLFACTARFFVIAGGALESAMDKIPPQLDAAARLAALTPLKCFFRVHLPLLRPAAVAAAVLIFLEGIKELPMTLILRPFNFDTLATIVYQYVSDEALDLAAPSALLLALFAAAGVTGLFLLEGRDSVNSPQ